MMRDDKVPTRSHARAFAWVPRRQWDRITSGEPWLTVTVYSENQEEWNGGVPLFAASPPPTPETPYAATTTDYLGCEYLGLDISRIERIAAAGSQGPTEVIYLYAGPPPASSTRVGRARAPPSSRTRIALSVTLPCFAAPATAKVSRR
jgi:hypothetical protein